MSEPTPTPEAPPAQPAIPAEPPKAEQPPQAFTQEQVNALMAEQKRKLAEKFPGYDDLKAKAAKLDEIEEASKTEQQRAAETAAAAQRERDEARNETLRYKAANTHGVDQDHFDLLGTGTEEEIAARAERVGNLLKFAAENEQLKTEIEALRQGKPVPASTRPVAALRPGATPAEGDADELAYQQYAGRFKRQ